MFALCSLSKAVLVYSGKLQVLAGLTGCDSNETVLSSQIVFYQMFDQLVQITETRACCLLFMEKCCL